MFDDLRSLDDGAVLDADICIVGAGAAGISMAVGLSNSGLKILLLEAGGAEFEDDSQSIYQGAETGQAYYPLDACRLRFFGGTTNHWGGRSQPLTPWDLTKRAWVPHSGWPIGFQDIQPYYVRAQLLCSLGPYSYGSEIWRSFGVTPPPIDPRRLTYTFWRYSAVRRPELTDLDAVRFGKDYGPFLRKAANVRILLHANLTRIRLRPGGQAVQELEIRTLSGKAARVRARRYVLACGAIENARMLLASDDVERAGVGNRHDWVGRCFMEHPDVQTAMVYPLTSTLLPAVHVMRERDGRVVRPGLRMAPEAQAAQQVLTCAATFAQEDNPDMPVVASRRILPALKAGRWSEAGDNVGRVLGDLGGFADDSYRKLTQGAVPRERIERLTLNIELEQAPNRDSRIILTGERDALGMRRPQLAWRLGELERRSVLAFTKTVAAELGRLGLARVRISDWLSDPKSGWGGEMHGSFHHLGTTRMADDPKQGVVDRNGRVHGVGNLYVAGGSVFATAGPSNPTMTIVALALRLGDHLRGELTRP